MVTHVWQVFKWRWSTFSICSNSTQQWRPPAARATARRRTMTLRCATQTPSRWPTSFKTSTLNSTTKTRTTAMTSPRSNWSVSCYECLSSHIVRLTAPTQRVRFIQHQHKITVICLSSEVMLVFLVDIFCCGFAFCFRLYRCSLAQA